MVSLVTSYCGHATRPHACMRARTHTHTTCPRDMVRAPSVVVAMGGDLTAMSAKLQRLNKVIPGKRFVFFLWEKGSYSQKDVNQDKRECVMTGWKEAS